MGQHLTMTKQDREAFYALCEKHLEHAIEKHPMFTDFVSEQTVGALKYELAYYAKQKPQSLEAVLLEEVYEFLLEMKAGNLEQAHAEAADIVAVLLRAINTFD